VEDLVKYKELLRENDELSQAVVALDEEYKNLVILKFLTNDNNYQTAWGKTDKKFQRKFGGMANNLLSYFIGVTPTKATKVMEIADINLLEEELRNDAYLKAAQEAKMLRKGINNMMNQMGQKETKARIEEAKKLNKENEELRRNIQELGVTVNELVMTSTEQISQGLKRFTEENKKLQDEREGLMQLNLGMLNQILEHEDAKGLLEKFSDVREEEKNSKVAQKLLQARELVCASAYANQFEDKTVYNALLEGLEINQYSADLNHLLSMLYLHNEKLVLLENGEAEVVLARINEIIPDFMMRVRNQNPTALIKTIPFIGGFLPNIGPTVGQANRVAGMFADNAKAFTQNAYANLNRLGGGEAQFVDYIPVGLSEFEATKALKERNQREFEGLDAQMRLGRQLENLQQERVLLTQQLKDLQELEQKKAEVKVKNPLEKSGIIEAQAQEQLAQEKAAKAVEKEEQ
jgi:hypothetical protein